MGPNFVGSAVTSGNDYRKSQDPLISKLKNLNKKPHELTSFVDKSGPLSMQQDLFQRFFQEQQGTMEGHKSCNSITITVYVLIQ